MTNIPTDEVGEILQDQEFTIVNLSVDPDTDDTTFIVVHDLHPEDEVRIKLVSNEEDGKDSMTLEFEGPDVYTDTEAKKVLNDVMAVILKVVENAVAQAEGSSSGSGSGSGSSSSSASASGGQ